MSWDVYVFNAPPQAACIDDLPIDFTPPPLGSATEVRRRLHDKLPRLDLPDPAWGHLVGQGWSIEFNIGPDDPVDSIMLCVRGSGDEAVAVIADTVAAVGGRALDVSTGKFLTGGPADVAGWHRFQRYLDRVRHDG